MGREKGDNRDRDRPALSHVQVARHHLLWPAPDVILAVIIRLFQDGLDYLRIPRFSYAKTLHRHFLTVRLEREKSERIIAYVKLWYGLQECGFGIVSMPAFSGRPWESAPQHQLRDHSELT